MQLKSLFEKFKPNFEKLAAALVVIVFALVAKTIVLSGKTNEATKYSESVRPGYETLPAFVKVSPSTSKAWELSKEITAAKVAHTIGAIAFWAAIVLLILFVYNLVPAKIHDIVVMGIVVGLVVIWVACMYSAYGNIISNTWVQLPVPQYDSLKAIPGALDSLFDHSPVIR